jgi:hypothetical protein
LRNLKIQNDWDMPELPFIDLHPDKIRGSGPETALLACRQFLQDALERGHRSVRIITGLGLHGDGTPRLRNRIEREVLAGFHTFIESLHYEQGGAVIRLELVKGTAKPGTNYLKKSAQERNQQSFVRREERLMVALDRLGAAEVYLEEGDLRRCRLKLNQVLREFFPDLPLLEGDEGALSLGLGEARRRIGELA